MATRETRRDERWKSPESRIAILDQFVSFEKRIKTSSFKVDPFKTKKFTFKGFCGEKTLAQNRQFLLHTSVVK
jgi:hypothetical protein